MPQAKPTNQVREENREIASLTLLQIFSSLKPAQAWAVITVIFAIISGSFGLGYNLSNLYAQSEIARLKTEKAGVQDKIKEFRAIQTKEKFLSLYLRYLIAQNTYYQDSSEENRGAVDEAGSHLRSYIEKLLQRGEETSDEIDMRGLFLGKTPGKKATVKFGYDGSIWPLPTEFGFAAKTR